LQITKSILNHDLKYFDFKSSPSLTAAKKRTKKKQIPIICKDHTHVGGLAQWVSALASINEVNQRRARLVLTWLTVSGFCSRCGTFISVCDQPPKSTQPDHPFVSRCNEYQPKGGDALRLGSKGRVWVAGKTV